MQWIAPSPSQSPAVTAPPKGEPLAKPRTLPYCQSLSPRERWICAAKTERARMLPSIMPLPVFTEAFPLWGKALTKPVATASKGGGQSPPQNPLSLASARQLSRGESFFCCAVDSVLALSVTCGDSSPKGGALGKTRSFAVLPKPLPLTDFPRSGIDSPRSGEKCHRR